MGQPLGMLPHCHPKLQQEAFLCGAEGQQGLLLSCLRQVSRHMAPVGLGPTCPSSPGNAAGTATESPSLPFPL